MTLRLIIRRQGSQQYAEDSEIKGDWEEGMRLELQVGLNNDHITVRTTGLMHKVGNFVLMCMLTSCI